MSSNLKFNPDVGAYNCKIYKKPLLWNVVVHYLGCGKKSPKFSMLVSETAAQFLSQLTKEFLQNPLTTYPELEVTH